MAPLPAVGWGFRAFPVVSVGLGRPREVIAVPGGRLAPLPCGASGQYLGQSVEAILESAQEVLIEVVVVDDGTEPPLPKPELRGLAWRDLPRTEEVAQGVQLLWLRLEGQGMAQARSLGAAAARGEAVAFLDCYVKPKLGWASAALTALRQDPRAVVVPALLDLDCESAPAQSSLCVVVRR